MAVPPLEKDVTKSTLYTQSRQGVGSSGKDFLRYARGTTMKPDMDLIGALTSFSVGTLDGRDAMMVIELATTPEEYEQWHPAPDAGRDDARACARTWRSSAAGGHGPRRWAMRRATHSTDRCSVPRGPALAPTGMPGRIPCRNENDRGEPRYNRGSAPHRRSRRRHPSSVRRNADRRALLPAQSPFTVICCPSARTKPAMSMALAVACSLRRPPAR